MLLPLIIASLITTSILSLNSISGVKDKISDVFETVGTQLMNRISNHMNEIVLDIDNLASRPELVNISTPLKDQVTLLEQFIDFGNSKYLSASIYDRNGKLIASTFGNSTNKNFANTDSFNQTLNGLPFFDKTPTLFRPNQTGLYYSAPIYDTKDEINRLIVIQVPIDFIDNIIKSSVLHEDSENSTFKFNSRIIHDDGSLIHSNNPHNLSSFAVAEDSRIANPASQPPAGQEEEEDDLGESILISIPENSDRKRFEDNGNWTLELEGDLSYVLSDYNKTINEFLFLSSIILAITIGATSLLIRKTILQLMHLKDAALEISKGNFTKPILVEGASEVKDLSISLEVMRKSIENFNRKLVNRVEEKTKELRRLIEQLRTKEAEVKNINEELKKANIAKEEFLSMVSHELKDPITPMKLSAEMLLKTNKQGSLNEFQNKALSIIYRNILKLETIINDIYAVYKLDLGNFTINKKTIDVKELVESNVSLLASLTKEKNITLKSIINTDGKVLCDPIRIGHVLANLVSNAVNHVPDIGGIITIRIDEIDSFKPSNIKDTDNQTSRKKMIFTVQDNGICIPADKIENLFKKRYYQIDTGLRRKYRGTGLGLVICKDIIESHGEKIWVDPSYRNGTSFKFSLDAG